MTIENKYERCEPEDPLRCQSGGKNGQCPFKAVPDAQYCPRHQGHMGQKAAEEKTANLYRLAKYHARVHEFAGHDKVKSLREEIGILRMLLEETLTICNSPSQLLIYSSKISDLVIKIEKLVVSCHRLEASTGALLDKTAAIHLASVIVGIISEHVTDPDVVDAISGQIVKAIVDQSPEVKA